MANSRVYVRERQVAFVFFHSSHKERENVQKSQRSPDRAEGTMMKLDDIVKWVYSMCYLMIESLCYRPLKGVSIHAIYHSHAHPITLVIPHHHITSH